MKRLLPIFLILAFLPAAFAQAEMQFWWRQIRPMTPAAQIPIIRVASDTPKLALDHTGEAGYKSHLEFRNDGSSVGEFGIDSANDGTQKLYGNRGLNLTDTATHQLNLLYNSTNYFKTSVDSGGGITFRLKGGAFSSYNWESDIGSGSVEVLEMTMAASAVTLTLGTSSSKTGTFVLKNSTNGNFITIEPGVTSASYGLVLPTAQGAAGTMPQNDGAGNLSWVTPGGGGTGGWTDDGTVVRLTTATDQVGIGTSTPLANAKLDVLGSASFNVMRLSAPSATYPVMILNSTGAAGFKATYEFYDDAVYKAGFGVDISDNGTRGFFWHDTTDGVLGYWDNNGLRPAGNVVIGGGVVASELRLMEPSGSGTNYSGFKAVATASNLVWSLPSTDSTGTQCLKSNGSLVLSFAACSGTDLWSRGGTTLSPTTSGDTAATGDGSTTAPGWAFASETWTGMYRPGTGILGFSVGTGVTTANRAFTMTNSGTYPKDFTFYNRVASGTDSVNFLIHAQDESVQDWDIWANSIRSQTAGAYFELLGNGAPAAGAAASGRIFIDAGGGGGKHRLLVQFGTGAVQVIATEP